MRALLSLFLLLVAPLSAQSGSRPPVRIDTTTTGAPAGLEIASRGDLSAILFEDDDASTVHVAVSDGRGLIWSDPVRIDSDAGGAKKLTGVLVENGMRTLSVSADSIYATWLDQRNAGAGGAGGYEGQDLFFARSVDGGATWQADHSLDKGYAPGGVSPVMDWGMTVVSDPLGDHLYVLEEVDPNYFGYANKELYLTVSHDGGASFAAAIQVAPGTETVRSFTLAADDDTLHLAYSSLPGSAPIAAWDVYYRRSTDGGASFGPPVQLDASGVGVGDAWGEVLVSSDGSTVCVAWVETSIGSNFLDLHTRTSMDGGLTFGADEIVGTYTRGMVHVDSPQLHVRDGEILLAWIDDRTGLYTDYRAYFSHSVDGGASWSPDQLLGNNDGAQVLRLGVSATTRDIVTVWTDFKTVEGLFTRDGGATFDGSLKDVSGPYLQSSLLEPSDVAFNELYGNGLYAWVGKDGGVEHVYSGGFRPQKVLPQGFVPGPTSAWFELEDFSGSESSAWVFLSLSPGSLPLPFGDGRNLGLTLDSLFLATVNASGAFLTTLDPAGSGSTPVVPITLPPGLTLYGAAVSLSLTTLQFGELTEVVTIQL